MCKFLLALVKLMQKITVENGCKIKLEKDNEIKYM